jgi:hypothetical protein
MLLEQLRALRPTVRQLERLPPINGNRLLYQFENAGANALLFQFLSALRRELPELDRLVQGFTRGGDLRLLGSHFICPRMDEYNGYSVNQQRAHRDTELVQTILCVAINLESTMETLIDEGASIDPQSQPSWNPRRAATGMFAYDTSVVHAGPGDSVELRGDPVYDLNRVFFMLTGADRTGEQLAALRSDHGLEAPSAEFVMPWAPAAVLPPLPPLPPLPSVVSPQAATARPREPPPAGDDVVDLTGD